jgi:hypothetical protein
MTEQWSPDSMDDGRVPIEANRRLVPEGQPAIDGTEEYFDMQLGRRVISLIGGGGQAQLHLALQEKGLPVFPYDDQNGDMLLAVPEGSRPLSRVLRAIARDVPSYRPLFSEVGTVLGRLQEGGFGLPPSGSAFALLGAFAFSLDYSGDFGGSVYLAPPYNFDKTASLKTELNEFPNRLKRIGIFVPEDALSIASAVKEGANHAGGQK